jgi:hypothetical protein
MLMSWASLSCQPLRDLFRLVASRRQPQGLPCAHNARWQQHGGWRETEEITERPRQTETPQRNKEAPQWPDHDRKVPAATDPGIYRGGHRVVRWPARPGMCRECVCSPVCSQAAEEPRLGAYSRGAEARRGSWGSVWRSTTPRRRCGRVIAGRARRSPTPCVCARARVCVRVCVCVFLCLLRRHVRACADRAPAVAQGSEHLRARPA